MRSRSLSARGGRRWAQLFRVEMAWRRHLPAVAGSYVVAMGRRRLHAHVRTRCRGQVPGARSSRRRCLTDAGGAGALAVMVGRRPTAGRFDVDDECRRVLSERRRAFLRTCCACTSISLRRWAVMAASATSTCSTRTAAKCQAPFLPLEAELWNGDRTRFTVFLDPGRVKRGILPNEEMGRALASRPAATRWSSIASGRTRRGLPLTESFTQVVPRRCPPDMRPLEPGDVARDDRRAPATRDPLTVTFPKPLDHGLLLRALGVATKAATFTANQRVGGRRTHVVVRAGRAWTERATTR